MTNALRTNMKTKSYSLAILILRIVFSARLIYGVIDNIISWERMLEFSAFLEANGFPLPLTSAIISVYLQFLAGLCWLIGYQVKWASIIMCGNFTIALIGVHLSHGDTYLNMAPAIHLLAISIFFALTHPGKYALDHKKGAH